jgi:flagella basal body P-ring formation protein FlgA
VYQKAALNAFEQSSLESQSDDVKVIEIDEPVKQSDPTNTEVATNGGDKKENEMDVSLKEESVKKPLHVPTIYPGKVLIDYSKSNIELNKEKSGTVLTVTNLSNEPISVGSHFNFIEANRMLKFDRSLAFGMRLVSFEKNYF